MREDDVGLDKADDRSGFGQRRRIVENAEVVEKGRMRGATGHGSGSLRFLPPHGGRLPPGKLAGPAAPVGQIPQVDFASRILQAQQSARHHEFDVVGMGGGGEGDHGLGRLKLSRSSRLQAAISPVAGGL